MVGERGSNLVLICGLRVCLLILLNFIDFNIIFKISCPEHKKTPLPTTPTPAKFQLVIKVPLSPCSHHIHLHSSCWNHHQQSLHCPTACLLHHSRARLRQCPSHHCHLRPRRTDLRSRRTDLRPGRTDYLCFWRCGLLRKCCSQGSG